MTEVQGKIRSPWTPFAVAGRTIRRVAMQIAAAGALLSPAFAEKGSDDGAAAGGCARTGSETAMVGEVIDGDTLMLADGRVVRLAGVGAPKTYLVRMGADVQVVAVSARRTLERLSGGKRVAIHPAEPARDRHGRILAELTLEDVTWLQQSMVDSGFLRIRPLQAKIRVSMR